MPFSFANAEGDLAEARVVIWTTTPWTIPSNKAVAYNDKIAYGLYRVDATEEESWTAAGQLYILADALAEDALGKSRVTEFTRVRDVAPTSLAGLICKHPFNGLDGADGFWDYDVPMIDGDHVTDDAGTGFVHTAPSHGADDYEAFVARNWIDRMTHNVGEESEFLPHVPFFAGLQVFDRKGKEGKANNAVIAKLVEAGGIIARGRVTHSYPHSWRSKAPIDLPQHAAVVCIRGPRGRRRAGRDGQDHPRTGPELDRPTGAVVAADRPQPPVFDDRGAPGLGSVASARLGRAADLLHQERCCCRPTKASCCAIPP